MDTATSLLIGAHAIATIRCERRVRSLPADICRAELTLEPDLTTIAVELHFGPDEADIETLCVMLSEPMSPSVFETERHRFASALLGPNANNAERVH